MSYCTAFWWLVIIKEISKLFMQWRTHDCSCHYFGVHKMWVIRKGKQMMIIGDIRKFNMQSRWVSIRGQWNGFVFSAVKRICLPRLSHVLRRARVLRLFFWHATKWNVSISVYYRHICLYWIKKNMKLGKWADS